MEIDIINYLCKQRQQDLYYRWEDEHLYFQGFEEHACLTTLDARYIKEYT